MWLFISFCLLYLAVVKSDNQLIVVENSELKDQSLSDNHSTIQIFQATKEWKEVNNEILPKGLHVRINLETGKKEAKLLDDINEIDVNSQVTTKYQTAMKSSRENIRLITDAEDRFLRELNKLQVKKKDLNEQSKKFKIPRNVSANIKSESEILKALLNQYNHTMDSDEKMSILIDLEYLAHRIDLGKDFYDFGGFNILMKDLNQTDLNQLKIEILSVFGSAIQSNIYVKMKLSKTNFLRKIVSMIEYKNVDVIRKSFFVLSTLLRNSPSEQAKFFGKFDGSNLLKNLFNYDLKIDVKIATFLSDITSEISNFNTKTLALYETMKSNYMDSDTCLKIIHIFENDLDRSNLILLLESMIGLIPVCKNEFIKNINLLYNLKQKSKFTKDEFVQENIQKLLEQLNNF